MNKAQLEQKILEETKDMPSETLDEILDFVKFKKQKAMKNESFETQIQQEVTDFSEHSLLHLEEEFSNYQERFPREQELSFWF